MPVDAIKKPEATNVVITGATGLIGKRVTQILLEKGNRVVPLVRNLEKAQHLLGNRVTCVHWDFHRPEEGNWKDYLSKADGVIHLAGTPLFKQRWTPAFKQEVEASRVESTRQLVDVILASSNKPRVFISASAVGIYGTDPEQIVDENSPAASDILAHICVNWEDEAKRLSSEDIRTVQIRIGSVLSKESGALKEMLPMFRIGLGGILGFPNRWINWIHIEDVARIFVMALANQNMNGPYNAVAPRPVMNAELARMLGRVLKRPVLMRLPVPLLKILIGEAGEYISGGPRALSEKIQKEGFDFFFEELGQALSNLLHSR